MSTSKEDPHGKTEKVECSTVEGKGCIPIYLDETNVRSNVTQLRT